MFLDLLNDKKKCSKQYFLRPDAQKPFGCQTLLLYTYELCYVKYLKFISCLSAIKIVHMVLVKINCIFKKKLTNYYKKYKVIK